jgi:hypothetical protein
MRDREQLTRGTFVRSAVLLPALAALVGGESFAQTVKESKTQVKYQDSPNGKKQCSGCTFFIAGKTPSANGTCKIVQGDISPKGYCTLYSPKS